MQYDRFVVTTRPQNLAEGVSVHTTIAVEFVVDVDPRSVNASTFYLTTGSGVLVPVAKITYDRRVATLVPKEPLQPGTVYVVHVQGCSGPDVLDGIVSALGEPLLGAYTSRFRTQLMPDLPAPELTAPAAGELISGTPEFVWEPVSGAERYKIELASTPNFFSVLWSAETAGTRIRPAFDLENGAYYWRVISIREHASSQPSEARIFTVQKEEAVEEPWPEDAPDSDGLTGSPALPVQVLEPKESPIPLETRRIVLFVPAAPELIDPNSFHLTGEGYFDDPGIQAHGEVPLASVTVTPAPGGAKVVVEIADDAGDDA